MLTKRCSCCRVKKPTREFEGQTQLGSRVWKKCASCREHNRGYYRQNRKHIIRKVCDRQSRKRKQITEYNKRYQNALRARVITKLGGKCVRCDFSDPRALQIDHRNSDGYLELRLGSEEYVERYTYLKRVLADDGVRYQLLCANCNWIKRHEENEQPKSIREKHKKSGSLDGLKKAHTALKEARERKRFQNIKDDAIAQEPAGKQLAFF